MLLLLHVWITLVLTFFGCSSKNENGRIKPYKENRSYWQYKGEPIFLLGGNKVVNPFQMEQKELMSYLDELQSSGGNYFRNVMSDREPGNVKAFKRLENGKYDLNQWNEEYWNGLKNLLKWSSERDIIVNILGQVLGAIYSQLCIYKRV